MIPSIFGTAAPKFVKDSTTILLDDIIILRDEPDYKEIIHPSIINIHREFVDISEHWIYEIKLNLHQYEDPLAKFSELKSYEDENVLLWKRRDGTQTGIFHIEKITPLYINTKNYPDYLIITFISTEPLERIPLIEPEQDVLFGNNLSKNQDDIITWEDDISDDGYMSANDGNNASDIVLVNGHSALYTEKSFYSRNPLASQNITITPTHTVIAPINSVFFEGAPGFPDWTTNGDQCCRMEFGGTIISFKLGGVNVGQGIRAYIEQTPFIYEAIPDPFINVADQGWFIIARTFDEATKELTFFIQGYKNGEKVIQKASVICTNLLTPIVGGLTYRGDGASGLLWGGYLGKQKIYNKVLKVGEINIAAANLAKDYNFPFIKF